MNSTSEVSSYQVGNEIGRDSTSLTPEDTGLRDNSPIDGTDQKASIQSETQSKNVAGNQFGSSAGSQPCNLTGHQNSNQAGNQCGNKYTPRTWYDVAFKQGYQRGFDNGYDIKCQVFTQPQMSQIGRQNAEAFKNLEIQSKKQEEAISNIYQTMQNQEKRTGVLESHLTTVLKELTRQENGVVNGDTR